jgi:hypothetical protein
VKLEEQRRENSRQEVSENSHDFSHDLPPITQLWAETRKARLN